MRATTRSCVQLTSVNWVSTATWGRPGPAAGWKRPSSAFRQALRSTQADEKLPPVTSMREPVVGGRPWFSMTVSSASVTARQPVMAGGAKDTSWGGGVSPAAEMDRRWSTPAPSGVTQVIVLYSRLRSSSDSGLRNGSDTVRDWQGRPSMFMAKLALSMERTSNVRTWPPAVGRRRSPQFAPSRFPMAGVSRLNSRALEYWPPAPTRMKPVSESWMHCTSRWAMVIVHCTRRLSSEFWFLASWKVASES
mmetsp:Transcript_18135/g.68551  ORF Transcript_18135/g.68551 Transcript_18135/m.68551 type:complete len:249 (-) Transcript_18135:10610-11356(-)